MIHDSVAHALEAAQRVGEVLSRRGIESRVIGASAMAIHGYPRATRDIDLATFGMTLETLRRVASDLEAAGLEVSVGEPDQSDPLGGVIRVKLEGDLEVDVVNFGNPFTGAGRQVGALVFDGPGVALEGLQLAAVGLVPLIILKLFAGSRLDLRDAAELVAIHPELDRDALATLADGFGLAEALSRVFEDASDG
jgi:hypothetical protein